MSQQAESFANAAGVYENVCIYHGGCDDGFASAVILKYFLKENVELWYGAYNKPEEWLPFINNKIVWFVDFSVKRDIMKKYLEKAKQVIVIDHHETAEKELTDLDKEFENIELVFNMEHSGAYLTWKYFSHNPVPDLILHIEDGDLWKFEYGSRTEAVQMALRSYKKDIDIWTDLIFPVNFSNLQICDHLENTGIPLVKMRDEHIDLILQHTHDFWIGGYKIKAANCPYFYASHVANQLMRLYDIPFALAYFVHSSGLIQLSLRSVKDGFNVAELAAKFGGGGHQAAAGCHITVEQFIDCLSTGKKEKKLDSSKFIKNENILGVSDAS